MYWFTGDEHYNHINIIDKFVFRRFANSEHMNAELIRRHNERVKSGHTVFHLGDFRFSPGPNYHDLLRKLNGNHVFLQGNHDRRNGVNTPLKYALIETHGRPVLLTHRPEDAENIMKHTEISLAFCGHVHEKWKFRDTDAGEIINVGVDQWDYYPVDAKQILKALKKWREGVVDDLMSMLMGGGKCKS